MSPRNCLTFALVLALAACAPQLEDDSKGNGQSTCAPGATQACVCSNGNNGAQSCAEDGSAWQACSCAGPNLIQPTKEFPGELTDWCQVENDNFSFFVTSMTAIWALSDSVPDDMNGGFGGDFQGLEGADSICQIIGIATGHGHKRWRAMLSATDDGQGNPVHAIDRIGPGPWYDANGRLVATGIQGLMGDRPDGEPASVTDLPNECGVPLSAIGDSHDVPTGSDQEGRLRSTNPESTCNDWTSSADDVGVSSGGGGPGREPAPTNVFCGHSFPRRAGGGGGGRGGQEWLSDHSLRGCGKGANLLQNGAGVGTCIGCSGGYGALYCFVEAD